MLDKQRCFFGPQLTPADRVALAGEIYAEAIQRLSNAMAEANETSILMCMEEAMLAKAFYEVFCNE